MLDWLSLHWIAGAAVFALSYLYLTWDYSHWKKRGIYYEKPLPFFGNYKDVFMVKKAVGTLVHDLYNKTVGLPYVGLFRFRTPALLIRDPEIIKLILVKEFPSFSKNAFDVDPELDPLFAKSPFFSQGTRWKQLRSLLSSSFTSGKVKNLFPLIDKVSKDFVHYIDKNVAKSTTGGLEAKKLCVQFTSEVVASCAFGIEAKCFEDGESRFVTMNKKVFSPNLVKNFKILMGIFFPTLGSLFKIRIMPVDVADFYRSIVKDVMKYRDANHETRNDFLQLLIQIKQKAEETLKEKKDGERAVYTDEDVTAHAVTFITEGFETSSITMSFLLYELAMNPDVQDKLRQELQEAIKRNDGELKFDTISALPYLNMVLMESLRLHPPLMTMEKCCTKRCNLPKKDGGVLEIEPGTLILIPVHALHYDPKNYPDPEKFDPERFSNERKDLIQSYTYLPFGEGPRVCIGMRFAQAQVKLGVACVVLNYDIKPTTRTPKKIVQDVSYFLAAAQGGLWLDFIRRN